MRVCSYAFVTGLVLVTVGFVAAAVGASAADRGGYTGMAVLWGSGALAAVALLVAIERRNRRN